MNNQPIGILDSGIGGLTVWIEIVKQLPLESAVYIGDSANSPYGNKNPDQIFHLASKMTNFLIQKEVKLIVIACNTVTVTCLDQLRLKYSQIPFIGTVPVVKTAAQMTKNGKIGILSTTTTAKSQYQKDLIERFAAGCEVLNIGTDELVPLVEKQVTGNTLQEALKKVLQPFLEAQIDVLALGCTHFPFLKSYMQEILGKDVVILDSGEAIARQVERALENNNDLSSQTTPEYEFFTTVDKRCVYNIVEEMIDIKKFQTAFMIQQITL